MTKIITSVHPADYAGRAPSSVGNPVDVERVTAALVAAGDGATVGQRGEAYAGSGILVALPEHGERVNASADVFTVELVRRWVAGAARAVSATSSPARYFGAWVDRGTLYLDVVEAFSDSEERDAIAAGNARGELAIFHAGRGECITLTGNTAADIAATY